MERSHFNLFLAAVYVAAALLAARHAGAQSGELRPASGSGGGDEATYQELVEEMRQRNSSGSLQAGEGGSGASPLHPSSEAFCGLYTHSVRLEFRGCVGYYLGISCTGRCYTEERPNVFRRRSVANVASSCSLYPANVGITASSCSLYPANVAS